MTLPDTRSHGSRPPRPIPTTTAVAPRSVDRGAVPDDVVPASDDTATQPNKGDEEVLDRLLRWLSIPGINFIMSSKLTSYEYSIYLEVRDELVRNGAFSKPEAQYSTVLRRAYSIFYNNELIRNYFHVNDVANALLALERHEESAVREFMRG